MNNPDSTALLVKMTIPTAITPLSEQALGSADAHCTKCPANLQSILSSEFGPARGRIGESDPHRPRPARMFSLRADPY